MNWRWIIPATFALAIIETVCGIAAYGSKSWNLDHTQVLTGWPAVRETCLIDVPLILVGIVLFGGLFIAALEWASRGGRQ